MSDDARAGETPAPITPDGWPRGAGYAHGVAATGRVVSVAGQVGWDPVTTTFESDDMAVQTDRALANVVAVLAAAGARPEHVVRMTWYITDRDAYLSAQKEIGAAYRKHFGRWFPAMSVVVVAGLIEPGALLEIEATAVV